MKRQRTSYGFLMEMLWVCGFFALAACIFVLGFVKADRLSRQADSLNHAVLAAQNALETTFSTYDASAYDVLAYDASACDALAPSGTEEICFDRDWNQLAQGAGEPSFMLRLSSSAEDGMLYVTAEVTDQDQTPVYTLEGARCIAPERSAP